MYHNVFYQLESMRHLLNEFRTTGNRSYLLMASEILDISDFYWNKVAVHEVSVKEADDLLDQYYEISQQIHNEREKYFQAVPNA